MQSDMCSAVSMSSPFTNMGCMVLDQLKPSSANREIRSNLSLSISRAFAVALPEAVPAWRLARTQ